tara:strand:- start:3384 stop:4619 length:1236 start_codon:yes stop_codon:yes gene_type:complete
MDGRTYPLSLFLITVAESGDRKTACDRVASKPLDEWQRHKVVEHTAALRGYRDAAEIYEVERRAALSGKKVSAADKAAALEALTTPEPPAEPVVICQEPTLEGLQRSFRQGWPSQALFNDEGGQFFGGHAMNPDNAMKTIAGLSKYWDGAPIIRTRAAKGESAALYDRRLSIHLQAQPRIAAAVLADPLLLEQGLLARFLIAEARSLAGTREYREVDAYRQAAVGRFHGTLARLLEHVPETAEGGGLVLPDLTLSPEARALWIESYNRTERQQAPGALLEVVKPAASKAAENALRLAGVFAVLEGTRTVTGEQMQRGWTLAAYYLQNALRSAQLNETNQAQRAAREVWEWLRAQPGSAASIEDMQRRLTPKQHRKSVAHIRAILALLVETNAARVIDTNTRGEPSGWEVVA